MLIDKIKIRLYRIGLKLSGAKNIYPIRGYNYLFGHLNGFKGAEQIWLESGVKLNLGTSEAELKIGSHTYINSYTIIDCHYKITIGKRVQIGPNCYIGDFDHGVHVDIRQTFHRGDHGNIAEIIIENNVWLGAGVIVLKGVTIGRNSVVAAGSVVTKNIPANVVAAGVPAKVIKTIENNFDDETYWQ